MAQTNTSTPSRLRLGVLGTSNIARAFIRGVAPSASVRIDAVASREAAKAEAYANDTGVARWHGSYEAMLADADLDAIYIPLPNHLHAEWAIRAAEAGKHVLCEKPLALTVEDARAMFAAARANGVRLVEAYPYRAQAQTIRMRDLLAQGAIGPVRTIAASFSFTVSNPADIRLDPARGGGALRDLGSYVVSLIRTVAGAAPVRVQAGAVWGPSGVDSTIAAMLEHADGMVAQFSCSFAAAYHRHAVIAGETGVIETRFLNHPPVGGPPELRIKRGVPIDVPWETIEVAPGDGFRAEAESFAALLAEGEAAWTGVTEAESLDIARTVTAILDSARSGRAVQVT